MIDEQANSVKDSSETTDKRLSVLQDNTSVAQQEHADQTAPTPENFSLQERYSLLPDEVNPPIDNPEEVGNTVTAPANHSQTANHEREMRQQIKELYQAIKVMFGRQNKVNSRLTSSEEQLKRVTKKVADVENKLNKDFLLEDASESISTEVNPTSYSNPENAQLRNNLSPETIHSSEEETDLIHKLIATTADEINSKIVKLEIDLCKVDSKITEIDKKLEQIYQLFTEKTQQAIPKDKVELNQHTEAKKVQNALPVSILHQNHIENLVVDTLAEEELSVAEDQSKFEAYDNEAIYWMNRIKALLNSIDSALPVCADVLSKSRRMQESWPIELQEKLKSRQEGLELVGKMLERLTEQVQGLSEEELLERLPEALGQQYLMALLAHERTEESARQTLQEQVKSMGNRRWQIITKSRSIAEERKNRFLGFIKDRVLKITDGVDRGELYSQSLVQEINLDYSDLSKEVNDWFGTYNTLRRHLLNLLIQVGVQPIEVELNTPIDYNYHEPFDAEPEPSLPDEYIKKVTRRGYEYESGTNIKKVLRPTQVTVVKN